MGDVCCPQTASFLSYLWESGFHYHGPSEISFVFVFFVFFPPLHVFKNSWTALGEKKRSEQTLCIYSHSGCNIVEFASYFFFFFFAFVLVTPTFYLLLFCRPDWPTSPQFLLPLPGLSVTSHWPWPTIVSCWNQLAATPGTRIIPVSLLALADWSLRA